MSSGGGGRGEVKGNVGHGDGRGEKKRKETKKKKGEKGDKGTQCTTDSLPDHVFIDLLYNRRDIAGDAIPPVRPVPCESSSGSYIEIRSLDNAAVV